MYPIEKHYLDNLCVPGERASDPPDSPGLDPEDDQAVQPDHGDGGKYDGSYQRVKYLKILATNSSRSEH